MRSKFIPAALAVSAYAAPFLAHAQSSSYTASQGITGLIKYANNTINNIIILLITCAVAAFFWGLVSYIFKSNKGDKGGGKKGLQIMGMGILSLFVMVSVWGLVHLLQSTFGVSNSDAAQAPSALMIQ